MTSAINTDTHSALRHLRATGQATRHDDWACYHTELWLTAVDGRQIGIVACAVGAPFAVLVAEELAASGCSLVISVTSAGVITTLGDTPYFILIERALRDEGTSLHYLPPTKWSHLAAPLRAALDVVDAIAKRLRPGGGAFAGAT